MVMLLIIMKHFFFNLQIEGGFFNIFYIMLSFWILFH